jgi:hypothetical protein
VALGGGRKSRSRKPETTAEVVTENTEQENTDVSNTDTEFSWDAPAESAAPDQTDVDFAAAASANEAPKETAEAKAAREAEEAKQLLHNQFPMNAIVEFTKTDWKGQYGVVVGFEDKRNVTYVKVRLTHYVNRTERPADKQGTYDVRPTSIEVREAVPAPEVKAEPEKKANAEPVEG